VEKPEGEIEPGSEVSGANGMTEVRFSHLELVLSIVS